MLRNDLLESGYHFEKKEPKKIIINLAWIFFMALFIVPAVVLFMVIIKDDASSIESNTIVINIIFIVMPLIYFLLKAMLTIFFCSDENKKTYIKLTANSGIPVWACREALTIRRINLMYLPPIALIYPMLLILGIISGGEMYLLILIFIMSFLMSYDVVLVVIIFFFKIIYKPDYISIDDHVYNLTLYYQKYIERKKVINPKKINFKIPKIRFNNGIPLILLLFIAILPAAFIYLYMNSAKMPEKNNSQGAIINGYHGSLFASPDITFGGSYTSGESLTGNSILYCSDFQLIIYYNNEKDSLMYLYDPSSDLRKLCIYERCEKNLERRCGHIPNFVYNGCYSYGYLYSAVNLYGIQNSYIVRYDIIGNNIEKLIEFDMYDENVYIENMLNYGRYLYVIISIGDKAYLNVVRIDLENQDACILYSGYDDEKITGLSYIHENYIISAASGSIYKWNLDMKNFEMLVEVGTIGQLDIYDGYIYYSDTEDRKLYRYNIKLNKREMLLENVFKFYIDNDFLYYTLRESDNIIYRAGLNGEYIDFHNKSEVYTPEQGHYIKEWSVKDENIYTLLYYKDDNILSRVNINSSSAPYIFWKKSQTK